MSRDMITLADVYIAIRRIQQFVEGISREEFLGDVMIQSAVLHQFAIIGEAVKRLSSEFREAHDEEIWKEYAGLRDV